MTRIIPAKFAEFSRIRYLVDPAQPDNGPIPLGVAIEVVIREQWFVGISARSALSPGEMTVLDGIAWELLQNPFEFLKREVHAVLRSAQKPGDVLATLSGSKLWSVNMNAPRTLAKGSDPRKGIDRSSNQRADVRTLVSDRIRDSKTADPTTSRTPKKDQR